MTLTTRQNSRVSGLNPTHRNELLHIGAVYLKAACDLHKVKPATLELIHNLTTELFLELQTHCPILPCPNNDANNLGHLTACILTSQPLPIYAGGTDGILGINKIIERAAHDYIHFLAQCDFTLSGEYKAFIKTAEMIEQYGILHGYSESIISQAISVAYSEIYLQAAAWDYLGDYPSEQKIVLLSTPFKVNRASVSSHAKPGYVG